MYIFKPCPPSKVEQICNLAWMKNCDILFNTTDELFENVLFHDYQTEEDFKQFVIWERWICAEFNSRFQTVGIIDRIEELNLPLFDFESFKKRNQIFLLPK